MVSTKQKKECNVLTDGVSLKCLQTEKKKTKIVSILSTSLVMHAHSFKVYHNTKQRKKQLSKCYEGTCFFVRQLNTLLMFERCH